MSMESSGTPAAAPRAWWRAPTVVIACGCLVAAITFGVRSAFGFFLWPISETHQWGREVFSLSIAIQNVAWGLAGPFAGAVADRYGTGPVIAAGIGVFVGGMAMMVLVGDPLLMHVAAGLLVGLGVAGTSFALIMASCARLVPPERRSWVFGVVMASGSFGQFVFAPISQGFIAAFDWEIALTLLAGCIALALPLAIPLRGRPEAATGPAGGGLAGGMPDGALGFGPAMRQAFGHPSFVFLNAGYFVCGFHVAFITVHLPPYLADLGAAPSLAAWAIGLVGLFNIFGAYGAGVLGDRISKKYLLSTIYALRSATITVFLLLPATPVTVLVFAAVMGVLWLSTVPPTSGLVAVMFGTRYLATLVGVTMMSHQIGAFVGVWLGGAIFDRMGSYDPVWWLAVGLGLMAAALHLPIRERTAPPLAAPATP